MIDKRNKFCMECNKPLDNCLDTDIIIKGDLNHLIHKKCSNPFDERLYRNWGGWRMKRIVIIESEEEEYVNRFADVIDKALETMSYGNDVVLTHFKED